MQTIRLFATAISFLLSGYIGLAQQLKLGKNPYSVEKSAILELQSDNQGLLLTRITDTTSINFMSPPDGMMIYFTPAKRILIRANGYWQSLPTIIDTSSISNFYQKTRSLFSGTAPVTFNNATGQIGITQASTSANGYLSSADWNTFNNKAASFTTGNLTETGSGILTIAGGTNAVVGSGTSIQVKQATTSQNGFLSSTDWNTFNNKLSTIDTTNISNFYLKVRGEHTAGTGIGYSNTTGVISNTGVLSVNGNTGALTTDTGYISNFSVKTRSLFNAGTGITYNAATGAISSSVSTANLWAFGGNTVGVIKNIGTIDNYDFPFITNNTERMRLSNAGNLGIGASSFDATNPEKLLVNAGTTTSVNAIAGKGSINSYLQLNIQNQSAGTNASSDVVATADNGSETTNYIDMGINSSANSSGAMGGANDSYLYNIGQNLLIGTGSASKSLVFMTGGTTQSANERMRIDGSGNVGIGTNAPTNALHVVGTNPLKLSGIQSGASTDSLLTMDATGIVRRRKLADVLSNTAISSLNGLTGSTQTFATGTSGTAPNWSSAASTHTLNIPLAATGGVTAGLLSNTDWNTFNNKLSTIDTTNISNFSVKTRGLFSGTAPVTFNNATGQIGITQASASTNGYLSSTDWNTFNNKAASFTTGNLTETGSGVLTITGGTGAVTGSGTSIQVKQATTSQNGFLSSTDWNTFNNKLSTIDTTNISNFYLKVRGEHTAGTGIGYSNTTGVISNTGVLSVNGNTGALTMDTGYISNFYIKSRSLLNAGTGITYNAATGTISSTVSTANSWALNGNTVGAVKTIGTIDNYDFPFITNNTERMRLSNTGNLGIGSTSFDASNPEKLLVNAGTTSSVNAIAGKGSINNYLQLNIQNQSSGTSASSDVVATADNGSETTNYIDMGINSSTNNSGAMGGANDAYLYNIGQNLLVGTGSASKSLVFMTGGTAQSINERMRIDGFGRVGIGVTNAANPLVVKDTLEIRRTGTMSNLLFSNTAGTGDFRIGGDGGDLFWQGGGGRNLQMGAYWGIVLAGDRQTSAFPAFSNGVANTNVLIQAQRDVSVPLAIQGNSATQSANLTEWRSSASNILGVVDENGNFGIGSSNPLAKLHVEATNPLSLYGVQTGTNTSTDSVLTITSGIVKKLPASTFSTASNSWSLGGNTVSTIKNFGTVDNNHLPFITNNTERMRLSNTGNLGIGTSAFNSTYPEKLVVDAGTTSSVNAIVGKGSINSYLQLNIQNQSAGTNASSDVVATADNGDETTNYVDMGINSSTNNSGTMGGVNDSYLYNIGQNFLIGTGSASKSLVFMTGGTTQSSNERMRIDGTGKVGIGTTSPTAALHLRAGTATASTGAPLKFTSGTNLTTAEDGAVEYDGTNYFATSGTTRYTLAKTLTATASLDFPNVTGINASTLTITVTGAADGDVVSLGVPNALASVNGVIYSAYVSSANTVTVKFSNNNALSSINPAAATFRVTVIKY